MEQDLIRMAWLLCVSRGSLHSIGTMCPAVLLAFPGFQFFVWGGPPFFGGSKEDECSSFSGKAASRVW